MIRPYLDQMTGASGVDHLKGSTGRRWKQTLKRGFIEQAFRCACVAAIGRYAPGRQAHLV